MENAVMKKRAFVFLLSEASGLRSRKTVTVASGEGELEAGTVLGLVTATGKYVASPDAVVVGKEGAETAAAILGYGVDASTGDVEVAVIDRDAEAKVSMLIFEASVDDQPKIDAKIAQLDAAGIRVR